MIANCTSKDQSGPKRVMVYRLSSIGDTVVALPCLKFQRRKFASARLSLLTNLPRHGEAPVLSVVGPMRLFDTAVAYPVGERGPGVLWRLAGRIRAERPDLLVYLSEHRGTARLLRDIGFFKLAGIGTIIGAPFGHGRRAPLETGADANLEPEAARMARCLAPLGAVDIDDPDSWNLALTENEHGFARPALADLFADRPFIAVAAGAKIFQKDWGEDNWAAALGQLADRLGGYGLVLVGGPDDRERAGRLAAAWAGPTLVACGDANPRQSAAIMARAAIFLGTDGGPMHLAAATGTRCCALFGPYNRPRQWHPPGRGHHILHATDLAAIDPRTVTEAAAVLANATAPIKT